MKAGDGGVGPTEMWRKEGVLYGNGERVRERE